MGGGVSDYNLDKIIIPKNHENSEVLCTIVCRLTNPLIKSHHDLIISESSIPINPSEHIAVDNVVAPRIENKTNWSDTGIEEYETFEIPHLKRLQNLWIASSTRSSIPLLLQ